MMNPVVALNSAPEFIKPLAREEPSVKLIHPELNPRVIFRKYLKKLQTAFLSE